MQKIIRVILWIIAVIFIIKSCLWLNPLRRCECEIKSWVLKSIPYGTHINDVESTANKKGWDTKKGYHGDSYNTTRYKIGTESMRIKIGEYSGLFRTAVIIFPIFDNDGKLIEIYVEKHTDSL